MTVVLDQSNPPSSMDWEKSVPTQSSLVICGHSVEQVVWRHGGLLPAGAESTIPDAKEHLRKREETSRLFGTPYSSGASALLSRVDTDAGIRRPPLYAPGCLRA
jgi:hypothetical protein